MTNEADKATIKSVFDGVVLVNVVHPNEGKQDDAIEILRTTVNYVAERYAGFKWSRLYRSLDGKTVINQAVWQSAEEFNTLFNDKDFKERYGRLQEIGTWEYHLYEVTDLILPPNAASS